MLNRQKVDVTIITPYHSEPKWMLERNINSVKSQETNYTFEHSFVVDNPDVDYSILAYISRQKHPRRLYFHRDKQEGLAAARNTALEDAHGDYIMLLDTDDVMVPNRIETQINFMKKYRVSHCYGGYQEIHGNSKASKSEKIIPPEFDIKYLLEMNNFCYCGSNCFTKRVYDKIGGFDENMKTGAEDLEYWIRIASNGFKSKLLPEVLYYLGVHDNNMTAKLIANKGFEKAYKYIRTKHKHLFNKT